MKAKSLSKIFTKPTTSSSDLDFEEIYYQFYPKIKKQIMYNAGPQYVDDISQEVFFKIYKSLGSFKNGSKIETWIYKITLNTCYDFLRKKERRFKLFNLAKTESKKTLNNSESDSSNTKIELQRAILLLSKESRSVFNLFYLSNLDIKAISNILEIPEGTVKSRLNKARGQIKEHFKMEVP